MKNYSAVSVEEAYKTEMSKKFIDVIRRTDPETAKKRIEALWMGRKEDSFGYIVGAFISLEGTNTCVDP